jgi:peroxiredoxin
MMANTDQPYHSGLIRGQIIPAFTLPGADNMPHSPWDYKQREHLILLFTSSTTTSEGRGLLRAFSQEYKTFREEQCALLAITADPVINNLRVQETLHLPFPLLSDVQGKVIARYTQWDSAAHTLTPAIFLADRYNALYEQWTAEQEANLPPISELVAMLQYLNRLCTP